MGQLPDKARGCGRTGSITEVMTVMMLQRQLKRRLSTGYINVKTLHKLRRPSQALPFCYGHHQCIAQNANINFVHKLPEERMYRAEPESRFRSGLDFRSL